MPYRSLYTLSTNPSTASYHLKTTMVHVDIALSGGGFLIVDTYGAILSTCVESCVSS